MGAQYRHAQALVGDIMRQHTALTRLAEQHRDHSIFSPSSSATWLACPGSLVAAARAPNDPNFYSAEGSVAHHVADLWLRSGQQPSHLLGKTIKQDGFEIVVDRVMMSHVEHYVRICEAAPGEHRYETRVSIPLFPIDGQGGTADFTAMRWQELRVKDFKYGQGIRVDPENNTQLMLYALGVFLEWDWYYDFQTIELEIVQPRIDFNPPPWRCDRAWLLAFADRVRSRARECWRLDAPRSPGEKQCSGCNRHVRKDCPAYLAWFRAAQDVEVDACFSVSEMQDAVDGFDSELQLPSPAGLPIETVARLLPMRKAVEKWFADLEARLFAHALDNEVDGWKIVEGRGNRFWPDAAAAEARLRQVGIDNPFTEPQLLSPNQAEQFLMAEMHVNKRQAKELLDKWTDKTDGGYSLVPASDKRRPVERHGDVFDGEL